jgi:molybdopterin converting factor subunit 1
MALTILYFAAAREAAGVTREALDISAATVADVRRALAARHAPLGRILPRCRLAVNQEVAEDGDAVPAGAEIAVIPPVSGGAPRCRVVERLIAVEEVAALVRDARRGAIVTFEGDVRGETRGRRVVRLEYEAYVAMAERSLAVIAEAVEGEHGAAVAILHRVGHLAPGEPAVVIAAAAPHRTAAFRACEATIERLKRDVPIWKREVFEDGTVWVGLGP